MQPTVGRGVAEDGHVVPNYRDISRSVAQAEDHGDGQLGFIERLQSEHGLSSLRIFSAPLRNSPLAYIRLIMIAHVAILISIFCEGGLNFSFGT